MTAKLLTFGASVLLLACSHEPPAVEHASATPSGSAPGHGDHAAPSEAHGAAHSEAHGHEGKSTRETPNGKKNEEAGYAVPFVWETSKDDPLAIARGHLKDIVHHNESYVAGHSKKDFSAKSSARSTVLTCSDAAVQLTALDQTPENDVFVSRNWGNLFDPALGSITYGIEQLHTPVLLILGHTGCEAIKAAMEGVKFAKPTRSLTSKIKIKGEKEGQDQDERWTEAVVYNVHRQVSRAVQRFQPLVHTGALTVVGAVYDSLDALGQGYGRVTIINVNSVTDPDSMRAFVTAISSDDKIVMQRLGSTHDAHAGPPGGADHHHADAHAAPHPPVREQSPLFEHQVAGGVKADGHAPHHPAPENKAKTSHHSDQHQPSSSNGPEPTHAGQGHGTGAHGLPQIDHLEPSLVGHPTPTTRSEH